MMEAMDVLSNWAAEQTDTEDATLTLMAATIMHKLGERHLEISQGDIRAMLGAYTIQRGMSADGDTITLRLVPVIKEVTSPPEK